MLVARTVEPEKTVLVTEPEPALEPGRAIVRVHDVALCGTDLHIWDRSYPADLPVVQGHEFSGVVEPSTRPTPPVCGPGTRSRSTRPSPAASATPAGTAGSTPA